MKNEFGVQLDKNGYAPSVIQLYDESCFVCSRNGDLARHEVFHGSNREKSKALGCWVRLCPECHSDLHTRKPELDRQLHQVGQIRVMAAYNWTAGDFRKRFGKSWI